MWRKRDWLKAADRNQRRIAMPMYEFECKGCEKLFSLVLKVSELGKEVACPHCSCCDVKQIISGFSVITSRKS